MYVDLANVTYEDRPIVSTTQIIAMHRQPADMLVLVPQKSTWHLHSCQTMQLADLGFDKPRTYVHKWT